MGAGHELRGRLNKIDRELRRTAEEAAMQWRRPKMVEIACGCEINAYFPADL
jgi:coenzyme PQQ precursor peptide PqqA